MYPEEATALEEIFSHLTPLLSTPPRRPAAPLSERHVDAIIQILGRWPISQRFPGSSFFKMVPAHLIDYRVLPTSSYRSQPPSRRLLSQRVLGPWTARTVLRGAFRSVGLVLLVVHTTAQTQGDQHPSAIEDPSQFISRRNTP